MNWIFEAYANVYNSAMMNGKTRKADAATAKKSGAAKVCEL